MKKYASFHASLPALIACLILAQLLMPTEASAPLQSHAHYQITDLGAPMGDSSIAFGISDSDDVTGVVEDRVSENDSTDDDSANAASLSIEDSLTIPMNFKGGILWQHGRPHLLGKALGYERSRAAAVNDQGQVVGTLSTFFDGAYMGTRQRAFLWHAGHFTDLGTLAGIPDTEATAVNKEGDVVGTAEFTSSPGIDDPPSRFPHAFLWRGGQMRDLGLGKATCINDRGQIAGIIVRESKTGVPFGDIIRGPESELVALAWLLENGRRVTLGAGKPNALNDQGQIVGVSGPHQSDGKVLDRGRAVLWQGGTVTELGSLGGDESVACGINNRGQVVGWARDAHKKDRAFVWEKGRMYDLNDLIRPQVGWTLVHASGINSHGKIVGWGWHGRKMHAFLLTPINGLTVFNVKAKGERF